MGGDFHPHSGGIKPLSAARIVRGKTNEECHATSCCDSVCSLSLVNAPEPNVLLSLEHEKAPIDARKSHCDFLFVGGEEISSTEWVAPIELTKSAPTVRKFRPQLQAGAVLAEQLIPRNVDVRFRPIAVHGKDDMRKAERKRFRNPANFVEFRGKKTPFKRVRCGSLLVKALNGQ